MKIFCMMLLNVLANSSSTGLYGTGIDTSQNIYNMLTNNGDIWTNLDSHLAEGMIGAPELDARDNVRDGKMRILKRKGTGSITSQNKDNKLWLKWCQAKVEVELG